MSLFFVVTLNSSCVALVLILYILAKTCYYPQDIGGLLYMFKLCPVSRELHVVIFDIITYSFV